MATQLTGTMVQVVGQALYAESTTAVHTLGDTTYSNDGRRFRYALAGASNLVSGTLLQAGAEATGVQNLALAAAAAGDTTITTTSTVTVTANEYAGGYVIVSVTPGIGKSYRIKSHPAATAAVVTLTLEDPIVVALTTSSRVDMVKNQYQSVVILPTTATSNPVGVAIQAITAGSYGWVQVGGVAPILSDGGSTVGTNVSASNAVAGAVEAAVTAQAFVGVAVTGVATAEVGAFKLFGLD